MYDTREEAIATITEMGKEKRATLLDELRQFGWTVWRHDDLPDETMMEFLEYLVAIWHDDKEEIKEVVANGGGWHYQTPDKKLSLSFEGDQIYFGWGDCWQVMLNVMQKEHPENDYSELLEYF